MKGKRFHKAVYSEVKCKNFKRCGNYIDRVTNLKKGICIPCKMENAKRRARERYLRQKSY